MVYFCMYDLIYFIPFPIIPTIFIWLILREKKHMGYSGDIDRTDLEDKEDAVRTSRKKILTYTKVFAVVFLLFLPLWSFSASENTESNIRHEIFQMGGLRGSVTGVRDPVRYSIGPMYDIEKVKEKMEENSNRWLPDQVEDHIDLDELTRVPGRLGVYWLSGDRDRPKRYVITYTYLAPYPVTKIIGFKIIEFEGTQLHLEFEGERTFIYPENPSIKPIFDTL